MARKTHRARKAGADRKRTGAKAPSAAASSEAIIGDRYRLQGTYERLRRGLLAAPDDGRLDRPLSYWVTPTDRRMPLALLDRTVRDLLADDLAALMQTPGVGQKKILGFFDLLRRALQSQEPNAPFGLPSGGTERGRRRIDPGHPVSSGEVSEATWRMWADTVARSGLADHAIGRVAPCLKPLPSVIWRTPLSEYAPLTLAQIRRRKTHGEKRVKAILGVFSAVHEAVSTAVLDEHLEVELQPRFVPRVRHWLVESNRDPTQVMTDELTERLVRPLLDQVDHDLGEPVGRLARERLAIERPTRTVKQQAARLKVTRARVYQLLDDCARMADVRWPEGRWLLAPLAEQESVLADGVTGLLKGVRGLFFPDLSARSP